MMRPRSRRVLKWLGLVICAMIAIVHVGGRGWLVHWVGTRVQFAVGRGEVSLLYGPLNGRFHITDASISWTRAGHGLSRGWNLRRLDWIGKLMWFDHYVTGEVTYVSMSLLIPLLASALTTIWLWRRDRRHPPGHCRNCGYDLTGNVTGVCSECGGAE